MKKKKYLYSGQALLIVLLSMAVVLVVVLSILARSITDVSISSQDEDSLRAFSAAEAGIERGLIIGSAVTDNIENAIYNVEVSSFAEGEKRFNYPNSLLSGESATVWFVAHDEEENSICSEEKPCFTGKYLAVCWGKEGTVTDSSLTPALELSVFYTSIPGDYSTIKIARAALDPNSSRRGENNFSANDEGNCQISSANYQFIKIIDFDSLGIDPSVYQNQNGLQFMKVRSIYNTSESNLFGVSVDFPEDSVLPSQGILIDSSGSYGNANRKIEVFKNYKDVLDLFDFSVFTFGEITK
ncbi:MAG: hypothetical protein ABIJ05_00545 [Patescibacteria group bacterium]